MSLFTTSSLSVYGLEEDYSQSELVVIVNHKNLRASGNFRGKTGHNKEEVRNLVISIGRAS